jgi:hypothetical protein
MPKASSSVSNANRIPEIIGFEPVMRVQTITGLTRRTKAGRPGQWKCSTSIRSLLTWSN